MDHLDNKYILPCLHYLIAAPLLLMVRVHYQELKWSGINHSLRCMALLLWLPGGNIPLWEPEHLRPQSLGLLNKCLSPAHFSRPPFILFIFLCCLSLVPELEGLVLLHISVPNTVLLHSWHPVNTFWGSKRQCDWTELRVTKSSEVGSASCCSWSTEQWLREHLIDRPILSHRSLTALRLPESKRPP